MIELSPTITTDSAKVCSDHLAVFWNKVSQIHIDISDGKFAPSRTIDLDDIVLPDGEARTRISLHLMVERPLDLLDTIIELQPYEVLIHAEIPDFSLVFARLYRLLTATNIKLGVAILPKTRVDQIAGELSLADSALIFGGKLGYQGGKADLAQLKKVAKIRRIKPDIAVQYDGGANQSNIVQIGRAGVDIINIGSAVDWQDDTLGKFMKLAQLANGIDFSANHKAPNKPEPIGIIKSPIEHTVDSEQTTLQRQARRIRELIIRMLETAGSGHPASALGLADLYAAIYFGGLKLNAKDDTKRDHLIISNGHTCPVLYASLIVAGLIDESEADNLRKFGAIFQGHPERNRLPMVETTSGALGEGLSQAVGMALANRIKGINDSRVVVILGDGELDEGQCWEAVMLAAKYKLDRLVAIIDDNAIQLSGTTEDIMPLGSIADKFRSFNWQATEVDGEKSHNPDYLRDLLEKIGGNSEGKPQAIILHTTPGKGVSFMENDYRWHGQAPNKEQAKQALVDLAEGGVL